MEHEMKLLIEHANITVGSTEEAIRFLGTAFPDFKVRGKGFLGGGESTGTWTHFGNDETYLALQENAESSGRSDLTYTNDGINHMGFVIEEMDALVDRMADEGYHPSDASAMGGHPYRRRAYFKDENGFEWEFVEYLSDITSERNHYG
jgi:hypothetical protein